LINGSKSVPDTGAFNEIVNYDKKGDGDV
jgi:hypothetical protein